MTTSWLNDMDTSAPLLRAENLVKHFPLRRHMFGRQSAVVHAVDGVNFELRERETMALVGESGCGKSTVGRLVLRLLDATSGKVWFPAGLAGEAPRAANDLPGPVFVAQSAHDGGADADGAAGPARSGGRAPARAGGAVAGHRRARAPVPAALSTRVFGRPAPAHRDRA